MKLIAHRGNTHGPDSINENNPDQIDKALALGYDAEVDIRYDPLTDVFWLGHDRPDYKVSWYWLANRYELLWMHCKDITTLHELVAKASHKYQYFFHNEDDFTLTSNNIIWSYPGKPYTPKSIIVMPEWNKEVDKLGDLRAVDCYGICTDYVAHLTS